MPTTRAPAKRTAGSRARKAKAGTPTSVEALARMHPMGEKQIRVRDAGVLLEAGIAELRADAEKTSPSAQILLGAAENMYRAVGDSFNAGVARKWLNSVKKEPAL